MDVNEMNYDTLREKWINFMTGYSEEYLHRAGSLSCFPAIKTGPANNMAGPDMTN